MLANIFLGVYPADKLPTVREQTALVVNTDTHDREGTHWLAFFIQDQYTLQFFGTA